MKELTVMILTLSLFGLFGCDGSSPSSPTSPTNIAPPPLPVQVDPLLTSSGVKITRSLINYHIIAWKFTIDSPKVYDRGYVVIRWFDANGFQVEWSNWAGKLKKGKYTYTDETWVHKDIWKTVKRRTVTLESWR